MSSSVEKRLDIVGFDRQNLNTFPSSVAVTDGMISFRLPPAAETALLDGGVQQNPLRLVSPDQKTNMYAAIPVEYKRRNSGNKIRQLVLDCASVQAANKAWGLEDLGIGLFCDGVSIDLMFGQTRPVRTSV